MPCPSLSVPSESSVTVRDLLEVHPFGADHRFAPTHKAELVRAVIDAGSSSLRALGSLYSLSAVTDASKVISTESLDLHLSAPLGASTALPPARIRAGVDYLATLVATDARIAGRRLIHVEAGIKVKKLLSDLRDCGLDLPTSGAGGGQSLAGALSTGTHGADFRIPVLGDWIRALHIASSDGREFWITGTNSPFGGPGVVSRPDLCADAEIIADDAVLDAARVAVGRFGVIYSMVLEVLPAHGLIEVYLQHSWPSLRSSLAVSAPGTSGEFDRPLADLESGWFRSEVRERVIVKYGVTEPVPNQAIDMEYIGGPPTTSHAPVSAGLEPILFAAMLTRLRLAPLAAALRGDAAKPLHHLNIAISLTEPEKCWVVRRWKAGSALPKLWGLSQGDPDPIQKVVEGKGDHRRATALIGPLRDLLEPDQGAIGGTWLPQLAACLGISEQAERIFEFRDVDLPQICQQHEDAGATIGEALFMVLYKLATDPVLQPDSTRAVAFAVSNLIGGDMVARLMRSGLASELLDTHDYGLDGAQIGNSAEYFFDASNGSYLAFVDAVIALANAHSPVFGYIGIRFMPASAALIGMPRFPMTASIEVSTPRSRLDDVYAGFWGEVHDLANNSGAFAHWGQESRQSAEVIAARYGSRLVSWRAALGRVAGASPTFSTLFTREHGLEPGAVDEDEDDAIDRYLAGLCSGDG